MPITVHLSGSTAARVILAAALLLVAPLVVLVCAPGLALWPFYPGRARELLGVFVDWTRAVLAPVDPPEATGEGPSTVELASGGEPAGGASEAGAR